MASTRQGNICQENDPLPPLPSLSGGKKTLRGYLIYFFIETILRAPDNEVGLLGSNCFFHLGSELEIQSHKAVK